MKKFYNLRARLSCLHDIICFFFIALTLARALGRCLNRPYTVNWDFLQEFIFTNSV